MRTICAILLAASLGLAAADTLRLPISDVAAMENGVSLQCDSAVCCQTVKACVERL